MHAQFLMVFPAYAIRDRNDFHYIATPSESTPAIVILTDDDLLDRYRADHGLIGAGVPFYSAPELALFLDLLPRHVTRIAIDPGTKKMFTGSIEDFLRKIIGGFPDNN
jgi:hypothetical protein